MTYLMTNEELRVAIRECIAHIMGTVNPALQERLVLHLEGLLRTELSRAEMVELQITKPQ